MSDDILNPIVQQALREAHRALGRNQKLCVLGDEQGRIDGGLPINRIRVREILSDGNYGRAFVVVAQTHQTSPYMQYVGTPVVVGFVNGEFAVLGQNSRASEALNLNPAVLNIGNPAVSGVSTTQLLPLLSQAVGTIATPSTKIGIKSFRYYTPENVVGWYVGSVANQVDLASEIPSAGQHCYVCVFFNTDNQTFTTTSSTPKNLLIPLAEADKQECFDAMPPYSVPVSMWRLADGQTSITQADFIEDLRPLFGQGTARQHHSATSAPSASDDQTMGYGVGSVWIDTSADNAYICVDSSTGASVWVQINGGGGGFTSFDVAGDLGTPQTIADADTLTIAGDGYTETTAGATDTVTVRYVASPLHLMGW